MNDTLQQASKQARNSGIELLKLFAIFLIIISHVVQSLRKVPFDELQNGYMFDISCATTHPQQLVLSMLHSAGLFGNLIFFICSAWFLTGHRRNDKKKALQLMADNWSVSVLILLVYVLLRIDLPGNLILKSFFPTLFENNWYVTCYVLFLFVYPVLNELMEKLNQRTFARVSFGLMFLYFGLAFAMSVFQYLFNVPTLFASRIINWLCIYFFVGYMKRYRPFLLESRSFNRKLIIMGFIGTYGLIFLTNVVGLRVPVFSKALLMWSTPAHPFQLMMALGLFSYARHAKYVSRTVNYIAGMSLFIYIIHENIILKTITREMDL